MSSALCRIEFNWIGLDWILELVAANWRLVLEDGNYRRNYRRIHSRTQIRLWVLWASGSLILAGISCLLALNLIDYMLTG